MVAESHAHDEYDVLPFVSYPSPERSPERLWWAGLKCGVALPPPGEARILEVGCSTGDHLLALAEAYPSLVCLGIDPAHSQIEAANAQARDAMVGNVRFVAGKVQELSRLEGQFDYIICHGVYSWVSSEEKREILKAITERLSEGGSIYLSHNSLPGWSVRSNVCHLLKLSDDPTQSPESRIEKARALLRLSEERLVDAHRPYGMQLKEEIARNLTRSDAFFLHELLSPYTHAQYLNEVIAEAADVGLTYLGDAHPQRTHVFNSEIGEVDTPLPEEVSSFNSCSQYFDILHPTSFRGSVFLKSRNASASMPSTVVNLDALQNVFLSSPLVCSDDDVKNLTSFHMVPFYGPSEQVVELKAPALKTLLYRLSNVWPGSERFEFLLDGVEVSDEERAVLARELLKLESRNLLEAQCDRPPIANVLPEKPLVLPFRRLRARQGWTVTMRLELFKTDTLDRSLIPMLDGTKPLDRCVEEISQEIMGGNMHVQVDGEQVGPSDSVLKDRISEAIQQKFDNYLEQGLLFDDSSSNENRQRDRNRSTWLSKARSYLPGKK